MRTYSFPVEISSRDAASALYTDPRFIWLDSARPDHPQGRYSYIFFGEASDPDCLGYAGFQTYEGVPHFVPYAHRISFDHQTGKGMSGQGICRGTYTVLAANEEVGTQAYHTLLATFKSAPPVPVFRGHAMSWDSNFSEESYCAAVQEIRESILNGDMFQANLTQRFSAPRPADYHPFAHYLNLREVNPAPFGAYIAGAERQILSASPESFLEVSAEGEVITRPIKGTADDPAILLASEKDRAENVMIVDLLRNDLSQVCDDRSVMVTELCAVQSFAGVHHLVSEVRGHLAQGETSQRKTAQDVLAACFPGGSITGAPKIKAMEVLRRIEGIPRGVYCGAIGWIGADGSMTLNIPIRTCVAERETISFGVGGGITALSDPRAEYRETLLKAEKLFRSFAPSDTTYREDSA